MKNVFADTNILIDLLADRPPFSKFAIQLFDLAEKIKLSFLPLRMHSPLPITY
jgi:hypothetical protein